QLGWLERLAGRVAGQPPSRESAARLRSAGAGQSGRMRTILLSVQTGMVVRDLLRCGPLERVLEHPQAQVVLLTTGVRDPGFVEEFAHEIIKIVPHQPYAPTSMVWRLMLRRWRHAHTPAVADLVHKLEERLIPTPGAYTK